MRPAAAAGEVMMGNQHGALTLSDLGFFSRFFLTGAAGAPVAGCVGESPSVAPPVGAEDPGVPDSGVSDSAVAPW